HWKDSHNNGNMQCLHTLINDSKSNHYFIYKRMCFHDMTAWHYSFVFKVVMLVMKYVRMFAEHIFFYIYDHHLHAVGSVSKYVLVTRYLLTWLIYQLLYTAIAYLIKYI